MPKLTLDDLKKMRDERSKEMNRRDTDKEIEIIIGMGTCGIAAGAKATFEAFVSELENSDVGNAVIKQTGCMGFCAIEPTVEVRMPGMPTTIYNKVDAATAKRIVTDHIMANKLVDEHITDKPSVDIVTNK